jgi:DNA-binding LacI/PurR family transcriptional regulator
VATIHDVAKYAGVSISTVSYVLSGVRPVSESTKQKVLDAMEALGYRPNPHARALSSKESHLLALFIPPTRRGLGETEIDFASHVSQEAMREGYHTILVTDEYDDLIALKEFIHQSLVDGIILMEVHTHDPRVTFLLHENIPFVIIGYCENIHSNWVDIDFEKTLFSGIQYFVEQGYRHIAFINQSEAVYTSGYGPVVRSFQALERAKHIYSCDKLVHYFCEANHESGYELTKKIVQDDPLINAFIVMNDRALPGMYRAFYEAHKRIPDDVAIISMVTSEQAAELLYPPLTTLEFPTEVLAVQAVQQLISQIRGKPIVHFQNTLLCPLVERYSTKRRGL